MLYPCCWEHCSGTGLGRWDKQLRVCNALTKQSVDMDVVIRGMPPSPSLFTLPLYPLSSLSPFTLPLHFPPSPSLFTLPLHPPPSLSPFTLPLHSPPSLSPFTLSFTLSPAQQLCTASGWAVKDMDVTAGTAAELFRILATSCSTLPSKMADIVVQLGSQPVSALQPSQKAAILSFLTDELLESPSLVK